MTRDETIALWKKCEEARAAGLSAGQTEEQAHEAAKAIWNAWAVALLAERTELVKSGLWSARALAFQSIGTYAEREHGENNETTHWLENAVCDFSGFRFEPLADADAKPSENKFFGKKDFSWFGSDVRRSPNFSGYIFPSDCDFWSAYLPGPVSFERAVFNGLAGFRRTTFENIVWFSGATFNQAAWFARTSFAGVADFREVTFRGWARFAGAKFEEVALFERARFKTRAWFVACSFAKRAAFDGSEFFGVTDFSAISVEKNLDMKGCSFLEPPGFHQSSFREAPDFDDVKLCLPDMWDGHKAHDIGKYRHIRRLAIQGCDHEIEAKAFKGEIRSKRGTEHKWYHAAFWYGLAYDALSDFGRSMSRPSLIWLVSIAIFALFYLASSGKLDSALATCPAAGAPDYESALIISWKNALPLIGIDSKVEEIARACLYGGASYGGIAIQGFQKVWSAVLLFLFLLAVRNQFKIK